MRVTENMRLESVVSAQGRLATRLDTASRVAARGANVAMPSDDPVAYAAMVRMDHTLSLLDERSKLATQASAELDIADGALSSGLDLLAQAREVAVGGASDTMDATSRTLLGQQVTAIRSEMLGIANTRSGTKYIFAGTKTDAPPFDAAGTFLGNDVVMNIPLTDGVAPPSNVSGARAFTAAGGHDVLADLAALATALGANDVVGIRAAIDNMDAGHAQLARGQTDAGLASERFRSATDVMASTKVVVAQARATEVEGDTVAQLTDLTQAKSAYERGIAVTKQLLALPSLVTP